jgi:hypothetical protein
MKHLIVFAALLLGACASTGPASTSESTNAKEEIPEGSPEAMMAALGGGAPKRTMSDAEIAKHPFGSAKNPVRVGGPGGERAYLARLRCEDGRYPEFDRDGSVGTGPYGFILDAYSVVCASGQKATVYMDMYHSTIKEDRAVPGFTIEPAAR